MPKVLRWDAVQDHWLAVEVSGVGSRAYDRDYKRDGYLGAGVKEVWRVDLDIRCVFVSRPAGEIDVRHDISLAWQSPSGREFTLDIAALFRGLPG